MGNPLWAKAPLVLLRFRGLFVALMLGTALLAFAAAASPLFLSATADRLVESQVRNPLVGRFGVGLAYQRTGMPLDPDAEDGSGISYRELREAFLGRVAGQELLATPVTSLLGPPLSVVSGTGEREGRLMGRDGVTHHLRVTSRGEEPGVWIADVVARGLKVGPGDEVRLRTEGGEVAVPVAGTYKELWAEPRRSYWRSWSRQIFPTCRDCPPQPELVLTGPEHARDLSLTLGATRGTIGWEAPAIRHALTLDELRSLERFAARELGEMSDRRGAFDAFRCCGFQYLEGPRFRRTFVTLVSGAPRVLGEVQRRLVPVEGPVRLLLIAGLLVALAVTAGAGAFTAGARRAEAGVLDARGVGTFAVGARASLEALLPAMIGAAVGMSVAVLLVRTFGPGGAVGTGALQAGAAAAGASIPVATVLVGAVTAGSFRRRPYREPRALRALALPWELLLLVGAAYLYLQLRGRGAFQPDPVHGVGRPDPSLLALPVLALAGMSALAGRLGRSSLRRLRGRGRALSPSSYLALRRLAGAPGLVLLLFAGSTLSLGTFAHAQTVVRSLETTIEAKAKLFVGSDVQAVVHEDASIPRGFPLPATRVTRAREAGTIHPDGGRVDLLAVDPTTLADTAYWNDGFADRSLAAMVAELGPGRPLPVIVAGTETPDRFHLEIASRTIEVRVVATPRAFPGSSSRHPLIVAEADGLRTALGFDPFPRLRTDMHQIWIRGPTEQARAALASVEPGPYEILTADRVMDVPSIAAVIDTFGVLNLLGLAAAAMVAAALLMYLQARQRGQTVSHALSVRMGMDHRAHRRAILQELGALLGTAYLVGLVLALGISSLVVPMLDPLGDIPPAPLFLPPMERFLVLPAALGLVIWMGGVLTDRRARRANLAEVMRVAE